MKTAIIGITVLAMSVLWVFAAVPALADFNLGSIDPLGGSGCGGTFTNLINCFWKAIFWIAIALAVLMFLIASFLFMTSSGDPKKLELAKGALLWAVIGLGIVIISGGLIFVICDVLGATCE